MKQPLSKEVLCALLSTIVSFAVICIVESTNQPEDLKDIKRLKRRITMYTCAVIFWPTVIGASIGLSSLYSPITASVAVLVALFLSFEVSVTSCYDGPFTDYDSTDSVYERSVQVSTVAFAVATLLLSQHNTSLASMVATPVFAALLFCTGAAVPSAISRRRIGGSGYWVALQKVAVSFAAGLLCIALARCIDEIKSTGQI